MFEQRKKVGEILKRVRLGELKVKDALLLFPDTTDDKSIMASYHALVHYEADEDLRHRDQLYREEQDDYIEFLSSCTWAIGIFLIVCTVHGKDCQRTALVEAYVRQEFHFV